MKTANIPWTDLKAKFSPELAERLKEYFDCGGPFEISAPELAAETQSSAETAEYLLEAVSPPLKRRSIRYCSGCQNELTEEETRLRKCPNCERIFDDETKVMQKVVFAHDAPRTRDVAWVLALHGMNTRGAWQEEFTWRVSTAYKRSVPVAIYKYGLVLSGAISRWYLCRLQSKLVDRIRRLSGETEDSGFQGSPDVIAHSLGTWMIGHTLMSNPSLKIGRLVLTGSILRPDFDWEKLKVRGQVLEVLNHYGTKDFWAGVAHYVIPDSGPSGRIGFSGNPPIVQVRAEGFAHSDYFKEENLKTVFEQIWVPFLTQAPEDFRPSSPATLNNWAPAPWALRATLLPTLLLVFVWLVILGTLLCLVLGFRCLVHPS